MNGVSVNVDSIEVHEIQRKNGIIMNIVVSANCQMIGILVKMIIFGILVPAIVSVISPSKLTNVQTLEVAHLFGKLVLICVGEILDTTETTLDDKKLIFQKILLIHTILLVNIWLLIEIFNLSKVPQNLILFN